MCILYLSFTTMRLTLQGLDYYKIEALKNPTRWWDTSCLKRTTRRCKVKRSRIKLVNEKLRSKLESVFDFADGVYDLPYCFSIQFLSHNTLSGGRPRTSKSFFDCAISLWSKRYPIRQFFYFTSSKVGSFRIRIITEKKPSPCNVKVPTEWLVSWVIPRIGT